MAEVIVGIGHLHEHNILYRDMKPENILLDREGHIVITDFGLSKLIGDVEGKAQTICGTPEYVAPEVLAGRPYGRAVDWWSVGTLLYEMIAGLVGEGARTHRVAALLRQEPKEHVQQHSQRETAGLGRILIGF